MAKTPKTPILRPLAIGLAALWLAAATIPAGARDGIEDLPEIFEPLSWHMPRGKLATLYPGASVWAGVPNGPDGEPLPDVFVESAGDVEHEFFGTAKIVLRRNGGNVIRSVQVETMQWQIPCAAGQGPMTKECFAAYNEELVARFNRVRTVLTATYGPPDGAGPWPDVRPAGLHHVPQVQQHWHRDGFDLYIGIVSLTDEVQVVKLTATRLPDK